MFSAGAIPVIDVVCGLALPLVGIVGWLVGWLLHGLGGQTRPFLWLGLFGAAILSGWLLAAAFLAWASEAPSIYATGDRSWFGAPLVEILWVGVPILVVVGLLTRYRRAAGIFLVGLSLPWILTSGAYVVDLGQGLRSDPAGTFAQTAAGILLLAIGIIAAVRGDPVPAPDPAAPAGWPASRRIGSMTRHLLSEAAYGQPGPAFIVTSAAWLLARLVFDAPSAIAVAISLAALVLAAEAELHWMPPQVRAALEAFHEIGRAALARFRLDVGRPAPIGPAAMAAWLASAPETQETLPARIEILTGFGRWDEAQALLEQLDPVTPAGAFRKAALAADLAWRRGGTAAIDELRALVTAIGPAGDPARVEAEGQLAWLESEVRLAALDPDWKRPLVAFRAAVPRAAGLHARAMRRRVWQSVVLPMAAVIAMVAIADGIPAWRG